MSLTLCFLCKRVQGEGCFLVVRWRIKMETSLASYWMAAQSTDNQGEEKAAPRRAQGDSGPRTDSVPLWNIPVEDGRFSFRNCKLIYGGMFGCWNRFPQGTHLITAAANIAWAQREVTGTWSKCLVRLAWNCCVDLCNWRRWNKQVDGKNCGWFAEMAKEPRNFTSVK